MELSDYLRVFRARWKAILVAILLGTVLAYGWTLTQPKVYTANASAMINAQFDNSVMAQAADALAKSRAKSYLDIARSRTVATHVKEQLGLSDSEDSLVARISVSNPLDTAVLRISATGGTPQQARDLAEAWVAGMALVVDDIESNSQTADQVVSLRTLDSAVLPSGPSSPNTKLAVALGLLAGIALGFAYALIRHSLDKRLRSADAIERQFDIPVLGIIPHDANVAKQGAAGAEADFATDESIRKLRTNLQFMNVDNPPRVMVITSSLPGDGKSTVTIKLAEAIAQSGQPVVVVDADLRRPSLAEYLGLIPDVGLTDALVGRISVRDALQPYGTSGKLFVLVAGSIPPNPSELLGSSAMQKLLYSLPTNAIVLVDTPPLIPVTDAAILTARTDGALVVVRSGRTTSDLLDKSLEHLDRVKGQALGVILDGVKRVNGDPSYYGYEYRYESDSKAGKSKARRARKR